MIKGVFVAGIGTDVGKTLVSAVLVKALDAFYWKPVQAGGLERTDSDVVRALSGAAYNKILPESFKLTEPLSPHAASLIDGVTIEVSKIETPRKEGTVVVEGAGGLMVPLNERELVVDLIGHLEMPVILVSRNYLGSINHTLLSVEALRSRSIPVLGVIFSGDIYEAGERAILNIGGIKYLGRINEETEITPEVVAKYAAEMGSEVSRALEAFYG